MKKLLASAVLIAALSACSQEAEEPAAPAEEVAAAPAEVTMESYVGTWTVSPAEGEPYTAVNNADGTYVDTMADGTTVTGTWIFGADQSCWTPEGGEEQCLAVGLEDENGTVTLTGADGVQFSATRVAEAAAETTAPDAG